jgi:hypothetical protein
VKATRDVDALLVLGANCVVYSPIVTNPIEVAAIFEAGINLVTPLGWVYPKRSDTASVEQASREPAIPKLIGRLRAGIPPLSRRGSSEIKRSS